MTRIELRQVLVLAGGEVALAVVTRRWLMPAVPPYARPHIWAGVLLLAAVTAAYVVAYLLQCAADWRAARRARERLAESERRELDELRRLLQQVHVFFRPEQLHHERDLLRGMTTAQPLGSSARLPWLRLLAVEGPSSAAWAGLARCLAELGSGREAIRCACEAYRCGQMPLAGLLSLASHCLGDESARSKRRAEHHPAVLIERLGAALAGDHGALGEAYQALDASAEPPVVRAVAGLTLAEMTGDREEAARLRERLSSQPLDDPVLRLWLTEAWAAYRRGSDGRAAAGWRELTGGDLAVPLVPRHWRRPLGLESRPAIEAPPAYLDPLPMYAVPGHERLDALADEMLHHTSAAPDSIFSPECVPELLAAYLASRLWPRAVRSRMFIEDTLRRIGSLSTPRHLAVTLEQLAAALWEEHGGGLAELCGEMELVAERLPSGPYAARALHAVGYAWWPRDPAKARAYWDQSLRIARRVDPLSARPVLGRFVPTFLELARADGESGAASLLLAADAAIDSGGREALLAVLQHAVALRPGRLREAVIGRLAAAAGWMDGRARFLLAWHLGDVPAMAEQLVALWDEPPDGPPLSWPETVRGLQLGAAAFEAPVHGWLWCAWALAGRCGPEHEPALRRVLAILAERARRAEPAAVAGALLLAHRLDELQQHSARPEARRWLEHLAGLPAEHLAEPLMALRACLAEPTAAWLEAVETALLRRLRHEARRPGRLHELGALRALIGDLGPAHLRAQLTAWLAVYRRDLLAWLRG